MLMAKGKLKYLEQCLSSCQLVIWNCHSLSVWMITVKTRKRQ